MAKCKHCGKHSFFTSICAECSKKIEAEERAETRRLADAAAAEQERKKKKKTNADK